MTASAALTRPLRGSAPSLANEMRMLGRCQRRILERIGDLDRRQAYRADGSTSMVNWIMERHGLGYPTARDYVTVSAQLPELPALADALALGDVSFDQLRVLVRVATHTDDADLARRAARWSLTQTEAHVRAEETRRADAAAARHRAERAAAGRLETSASATPMSPPTPTSPPSPSGAPTRARSCDSSAPAPAPTRAGTLRLRPHAGGGSIDGWLPAEDFATVESVLVAMAKSSERDPATGDYVPLAERLAGALVDLLRTDRADGTSRPPTVVVHCDVGLLAGEADGTSVGVVDGVGPISAEVIRRLACDAQLRLALEADGVTLDLGRARRIPSQALVREVMRRDQSCRFPGCQARRFLQIHHVVWWENGGPTDLDNLAAHCARDHHRIHHGGWRVAGRANGELRYIAPDGRTLVSTPDPAWEAPKRRRTDRLQR